MPSRQTIQSLLSATLLVSKCVSECVVIFKKQQEARAQHKHLGG